MSNFKSINSFSQYSGKPHRGIFQWKTLLKTNNNCQALANSMNIQNLSVTAVKAGGDLHQCSILLFSILTTPNTVTVFALQTFYPYSVFICKISVLLRYSVWLFLYITPAIKTYYFLKSMLNQDLADYQSKLETRQSFGGNS